MNKIEFKNELENNLKELDLNKTKKFIAKLGDIIPDYLYEKVICIAKDINGNLTLSIDEINKKMEIINNSFKEIEEGNVCFKSYSYEAGYGPFGSDYDYEYFNSSEINDIINNAYEFSKKLIYYKEYYRAIEVLELILYTNYSCEEVENPEYGDVDSVLDTYDVDINTSKEALDFNLDYVYLYLIYATLASNRQDKCEKIYKYMSDNYYIKIDDSLNLGIEEIKNIDKFYDEFKKYLINKNNNKSKIILEKIFNK